MRANHQVAVLLADSAHASGLAEDIGRRGANPAVAGGTDDLYQLLNRVPTDLIVIEHKLSGFLTGLEILERLFSDLLRPAIVLIGELNKEEQQRATAIGVQSVLPRQATADQIVDTIFSLLADVQQKEFVIPELARKVVQQADYIRPLPQLLIKLVGHLSDKEIDANRLIRDISADPVVAADLLKYANSSALGRRQKTTKIGDAVTYFGPRKAVGMVVSAGMLRARSTLIGELPPLMRHWHSCRAVLTACTAAAFAESMEKISEESAYLLGLMQDVGILVMARAFGTRYSDLIERVRRIPQLNLARVEQETFGITHADVSAGLLWKWELPGSLVSIVFRHHDGDLQQAATADQRFLRAMQIGEAFADLHDNRAPQRYYQLRKLMDAYGSGRQQESRDCLARALVKTVEASELFSIPAPDKSTLDDLVKSVSIHDLTQGLGAESADELSAAISPSDEDLAVLPRAVAPGSMTPDSMTPDSMTPDSMTPDSMTPDSMTPDSVITVSVTPASVTADSAKPASKTPPADAVPDRNGDLSAGEERSPSIFGQKVLVIDDDPLIVNTIGVFLRKSPYTMASCATISEALQFAWDADFILCDVHLGRENGTDLVRKLRRQRFTGPIIAISGDCLRSTVVGSIEAGVSDFLIKPFSRAQLLEKLEKHVQPNLAVDSK